MTMRAESYNGFVVDGPWKGQYIEADAPEVPHEMLGGGHYRHSVDVWRWVPPEARR